MDWLTLGNTGGGIFQEPIHVNEERTECGGTGDLDNYLADYYLWWFHVTNPTRRVFLLGVNLKICGL